MKKDKLKLIIAFCALGVCGLAYIKLMPYLTAENIQKVIEPFGVWAPVIYVIAFIFLPIFIIPASVMDMAGGLLFGLIKGGILAIIGSLINYTLCFFMARSLLRDSVQRIVDEKLSESWKHRLEHADGKEGTLLLIIARIIPVIPTTIISYAFGLSAMSYKRFILGSLIGVITNLLAFTNLGEKALTPGTPEFWIAVALLIALLIVSGILWKSFLGKDKERKENNK